MAVTAFADEVRRVRTLGVGTNDIAVAVGAQPATVNAWARAARRPTGAKRERFMELVALVDRLERVMQPRYVPLWLLKPVPAVGGSAAASSARSTSATRSRPSGRSGTGTRPRRASRPLGDSRGRSGGSRS